MILTATINEVKRRILFDNPQAVVAVKGDYEVNGIAFAFPSIYEDDFNLSEAVKTVYYEATDGNIYNHIVTETDTDTGYPLWVFKDEINKGEYGDVDFALVCDKVENGTIVKRWVSLITVFRVQRSIPIDEAAQEDNEQTYSERLAYLMTQMANMQATVSGLASGAPTAVSLASAMTDTSRLYVYTGSESGYTAGHWYYYNGSAWADGGQYGGASIDTTLTVSGAAADAKVVGNKLGTTGSKFLNVDWYVDGTPITYGIPLINSAGMSYNNSYIAQAITYVTKRVMQSASEIDVYADDTEGQLSWQEIYVEYNGAMVGGDATVINGDFALLAWSDDFIACRYENGQWNALADVELAAYILSNPFVVYATVEL